MADGTLKRNLDRAFDPGPDFPHPLLMSRTMAMLEAEAKTAGRGQERRMRDRRQPWAMTLVAALLALAIVAALLFTARSLHPRQITPANPIPHRSASSASCIVVPERPSQVIPEKMLSPTTGWAQGALRTTDGGLHWHDTSGASLPNRAPGFPGYDDFFLDSTHAWTAQAVSSPTSCSAVTFRTSDSGQTWQQSEPVSVDVQADSEVGLQLYFIDARHGWLLAEVGQWMFGHGPIDAYLYDTSDGGLHWREISHRPGTAASGACEAKLGNVVFASQTTGWSRLPYQCDTTLLVTHDGGVTWQAQRLPHPKDSSCPCSASLPIFFDQERGIVSVFGDAGQQSLLATSDGGRTWSYRALPTTGYSLTIDFIDANTGWDIVTPPGWSKLSGAPKDWVYRTNDGGQTWTLVQSDLPLGFPILGLWFVDANNGFALQQTVALTGDELLRTTDGGHTWKVIETQILRT